MSCQLQRTLAVFILYQDFNELLAVEKQSTTRVDEDVISFETVLSSGLNLTLRQAHPSPNPYPNLKPSPNPNPNPKP